MKKIAVILSGCGVYDGAEIHESTLTLLAISKAGAMYHIFAPNQEQFHVVNHLNGEIMEEKRNVLVEAARIARGNINDLNDLKASNYDAVIMPGGFGVAKNLSNFALEGADFNVNQVLQKILVDFHAASKPIGALCISPVVIAKVFKGTQLTIGKDMATIDVLNKLEAKHIENDVDQITVDTQNKIVTTPCYMLDTNIANLYSGIEKLVAKILELA